MPLNLEIQHFIQQDEKEVLQSTQRGLIIFTGPTGSGKDTVRAKVCQMNPNIGRIVSSTTRAIREGEEAGVHYNFLSTEQFRAKSEAGDFLEVNKYGDNYYGTDKNNILSVLEGKQLTWILSMSTVPRLPEIFSLAFDQETATKLSEKVTIVFVGVPRLLTLKSRCLERENKADKNNLIARLRDDWSTWIKYKEHFPNVVINAQGEIDETVEQVMNIISKRE